MNEWAPHWTKPLLHLWRGCQDSRSKASRVFWAWRLLFNLENTCLCTRDNPKTNMDYNLLPSPVIKWPKFCTWCIPHSHNVPHLIPTRDLCCMPYSPLSTIVSCLYFKIENIKTWPSVDSSVDILFLRIIELSHNWNIVYKFYNNKVKNRDVCFNMNIFCEIGWFCSE